MSGSPVRMGPLNMNGLPDADGDFFIVRELAGLWEPEVELETTDADIGALVDDVRYRELNFEIVGTAYSRDNTEYDVLRTLRKLRSAYWPRGVGTLYVDYPSPGVPVQLAAQRRDSPDFPAPSGNVQEFVLPMVAADPRKYSQSSSNAVVNGAAVSVVNSGDYKTPARATLQTQATNPWIQHDSIGRITLEGVVPAGTTIDFGLRRVFTPGGVPTEIAARPRVWWELAPGANSIRSLGNWVLSFRDAFI